MATEHLSYLTIEGPGSSEFRDKGSKFLGFCFPVDNREEIKKVLKSLKNEHSKANHHCYGWRLGTDGLEFITNDNGEPSGSAGVPILGRIDSIGLTNVLVVIIRYFGGTLLGIRGLINAYKTTAEECLKAAIIVEKEVRVSLQITFDYTAMNSVMRLIRKYNVDISRQDSALFCNYTLEIPLRSVQEFKTHAQQIQGLNIKDLK